MKYSVTDESTGLIERVWLNFVTHGLCDFEQVTDPLCVFSYVNWGLQYLLGLLGGLNEIIHLLSFCM